MLAQDFAVTAANTAILDTNAAEYAFSGRAEMKFAGTWEQFNEITSPVLARRWAFMAGVGAAYLDSDDSPSIPSPTAATGMVTGDLSSGGWAAGMS